MLFNPLNAELNPIFHLVALVGAHYILHVSRIRVNIYIYIMHLVLLFVLSNLLNLKVLFHCSIVFALEIM